MAGDLTVPQDQIEAGVCKFVVGVVGMTYQSIAKSELEAMLKVCVRESENGRMQESASKHVRVFERAVGGGRQRAIKSKRARESDREMATERTCLRVCAFACLRACVCACETERGREKERDRTRVRMPLSLSLSFSLSLSLSLFLCLCLCLCLLPSLSHVRSFSRLTLSGGQC